MFSVDIMMTALSSIGAKGTPGGARPLAHLLYKEKRAAIGRGGEDNVASIGDSSLGGKNGRR